MGCGAAFSTFVGTPADHFGIAAVTAAVNSAQLWVISVGLFSAGTSWSLKMLHRLSSNV